MKKVFFVAACAFAFINASAEDILQVTPGSVIKAGLSSNDWEEYFTVELNNTKDYTTLQFDIYLPEGMTLVADEPIELSSDRFDGVTKRGVFTPYATCSATDLGNGHYFVTLYHEDLNVIKGTSGDLMYFYYLTDSSMKPGVYPIVIKETELSVTAFDYTQVASCTSYVKVEGTPEVTSLTLEGVIPSFVNDALAKETGISTLNLNGVTASNGTFTYVAGRDVVGTTATASVKYEGNNDGFYSVNVPFDGTATGNLYELKSADANYAIFDPATSVVAGKTYLAKGEVSVSAPNAAVATVATQTNATGSYVKDGKFWHGSNLTVPATRGLFDVPAGSNLRIVVDGELTGITTAQIEAGEASYDLQGRQVQEAHNGVFVVNGKKQFVK